MNQPFYGDRSLFAKIAELGHEPCVDLTCGLCGADITTMQTKKCVVNQTFSLTEDQKIAKGEGVRGASGQYIADRDW